MRQPLMLDPDLGQIDVPEGLKRMISLPGAPTRFQSRIGEVGIFVMKAKRPVFRCGGDYSGHAPGHCGQMAYAHTRGLCGDPQCLVQYEHGACADPKCLIRYDLTAVSITHNERVDAGAAAQDALVFGAGTTRFLTVAVANGTLTKAQTDKSLGIVTQSVTTNEYTTVGLSRSAGSLSTYTAPASLGGTFSRIITKTFTVSGAGGTAYGAGLFDSATVSGSTMYVEDNFSSTAVLVSGDTLQVNATISN